MERMSKILLSLAGISVLGFVITRFLVGVWIPFLWIPIGLFFVFVFAALYRERKSVTVFLSMKTTKHGMNMGALIGLVFVVLVVANFLSIRHYKVWDFSGSHINTLSDQSIKLVKSLKGDLWVRFFYKKGTEGVDEQRKQFRDLLKKYQDQSASIKLEFIELNERPDLAEKFGVTKGSGSVFLEYQGQRNRIEKIDEQDVTNALVKVTREKDKIVYFIGGHGEKSLEDSREGDGINALKLMLENNRYVVKPLALNLNAKIPEDADAAVMIGPNQRLLDYEIQGLEDYLRRGGSLFVALKSRQTQGFEKVLSTLGIVPMNNYVLNLVETPAGTGIQQGQTIATVFSSSSEITKVFDKNGALVFRNPMSFRRQNTPEGVSIDDLVKVPESSMSFESLDIKDNGPQGSYTLAMLAKGKFPGSTTGKEFNLIVIGETEFLGNQLLGQILNRDLVLNSMAFLSKEENLISVTPKENQVTKLILTDSMFYLFVFLFAIPLPLFLLGTSVTLWMKRRHA
ncbi:MAG: Gldg family protein [Bdellovibrionaceae bacterium]|nr:Gldg family protein [Pseudobdellovibrionaceae bacterium]